MSGFSDDERERIREELIEVGREILLRYGPRKTNITDITEPVGIAKGSFYLFFDSKSDLYLEIMNREITAFIANLDSEISDIEDPRDGFEQLCRCYRRFSERNPLVQELLAGDDHGRAFRDKTTAEELERIQQEGFAEMVPYIETLQERSDGLIADVEPSLIIGLMGTIGLVVLHREEYESYGESYYDHVQDLLIATLARGLTS